MPELLSLPRPRRAITLAFVWVLAGGLAACGGDDPDPPPATTGSVDAAAFCGPALARVDSFMALAEAADPVPDDPRYGGTVSVGGGADILGGMNALGGTDVVGNQHHLFVNLMTLVRYDENYQPLPYLAESWEVAPDQSSITFRLRTDVVWHDGERTDAYDVAFSYDRASDPETNFPNSAYWDFYGPAEVVDSFTVRIAMETHAEHLDVWRAFAILPEHLLGDVAPDRIAEHPFGQECPVGNGPWVFVSHIPQESWTFRANPAFPDGLGGRPMPDRYVYRVIPEQATLLSEVLTEGLHLYHQLRPDQAGRVASNERVRLAVADSRDFVFIAWNTRRPTLADPAVRRALARGVDRAGLVEALSHGYAEVATASVPPFHWAHDPAAGPDLGYDPEAARTMLDEAGWSDRDGDGVRENADGEPLEIELLSNTGNQTRIDVAQIVQAHLAEIGVAIDFRTLELGTLYERVTDPASRDFDGFLLTWSHEFRVDDSNLFHSARMNDPYQFSGIEDAELDRLIDTLRVEPDRAVAGPLWSEYQARVAELQPFMFLYYPQRLSAVSNRLRGVEIDARGEWASIRNWWIDRAGGEDR